MGFVIYNKGLKRYYDKDKNLTRYLSDAYKLGVGSFATELVANMSGLGSELRLLEVRDFDTDKGCGNYVIFDKDNMMYYCGNGDWSYLLHEAGQYSDSDCTKMILRLIDEGKVADGAVDSYDFGIMQRLDDEILIKARLTAIAKGDNSADLVSKCDGQLTQDSASEKVEIGHDGGYVVLEDGKFKDAGTDGILKSGTLGGFTLSRK